MKKVFLIPLTLMIVVSAVAQTTSTVDTLGALADDTASSVLAVMDGLGATSASVRVLPISSAGSAVAAADMYGALLSTRLSQRSSAVRVLTASSEEPAAIEVRTEALVSGIEVLLVAQVVWTDDETIRGGAEIRGELDGSDRSAFLPAAASFGVSGTSGAGEPDDTPEQAMLIDANDRVGDRSVDRQGDVDWYAVYAADVPYSEEGAVMLTVETRGNTDTYIELYGPDDPYTLVAENDDYNDANARVSVPVYGGETYYVAVRGFADSSTGPYSLETGYYVAMLDPYEPDNSLEEATPLMLGDRATGHTITPGDDVDWYRIEFVTVPETLIVSFRTEGELDTVVDIFDEAGMQIGSDDDSGGNGNANLLYLVDRPGTYYALVRTFSGSTEGPYTFSVTLDDSEPDVFEPDNAPETASVIELNAMPQVHTFLSSGDVDWLVFDVSETATIVVETYGDTDSYLRLYNEQLSLLAEDDDSGSGFNAQIRRPLSPGRYFVEASPLFGEANARYEIGAMTQ